MQNNLTEKQKMLADLDYFAFDSELVAERLQAKTLCHQFNQTAPADIDTKKSILQKLLGSSDNPYIEPPFFCDYGYNIHTGKNFYANHGVIILDTAPIIFGDNVLLAPAVIISAASHPLDVDKRSSGLETSTAITVGNNVWVGMGAKILPGITIGDNSVIAAGAVVSRNIPPNCVVAGVPAKIIRYL